MNITTSLRLLVLLGLLTATACITRQPSSPAGNVDISKILEEVNNAITKSIPNDPNFPALSSIGLDLQVSVGTSVSATLPINVVSVTPSLDTQKQHRVQIDFVPQPVRQPSSVVAPSREESQLTAAISALYNSVANASPVYRLQRGSISLQCTLKMQGSAAAKLVPLQANASASRQVIQTLTINFGRDPNRTVFRDEQTGGAQTPRTGGGTGGGAVVPTQTPTTTPIPAPVR